MEQLTMFNDNKRRKSSVNSLVLSASRMTDMPKFYPDELINEVQMRLDKGIDIHSLVLWSKHPDSLLSDKLKTYLIMLKEKNIQLYFQCTITGLGSRVIGVNTDGSQYILEPGVPYPYKAIRDLNEVINILGSPLRVKLRIDPIVRIKNKLTGEVFSNITLAEEIIRETSNLGINNYTFSFLESNIHKKVDRRFRECDWEIISPSFDEKLKVYNWLKSKAEKYSVQIKACCVNGLEESSCIDGYLLNDLHENNKIADLHEPRKRKLCACTHSIDIGGWPPKKCLSGCKYCYANAVL